MKNKILFLIAVATLGLTAATMAQNLPIYVPANGLVGWWPCNGNANDESGNGNNGAINGAVLSIDRFGYSNQAFNFDGINDRIKIPFNLSFTNHTGSISLWMYSTQLPTVNDPQDCLFGKGWGYPQLVYRNNSKVYIQIANSSSSFPSVGTQSNISSNTWTHVLAIYEGPSLKIYINGTLNNSQILSLMPNYYSFCNSEFWIGGFRHQNSCMPNDSVQFFQGRIDDVGFWNRALTQQEITNLYNFQFPTQTSLCLPSVTTNTPTSIGIDSVVIGGDILNDGGSSIVLRGVCYSTTPNPNMGNPRTEEGSGIGSFTSTLRNLSPSTTYYARSYAKNSQGVVVYGNEVSFSTGTPIPFFSCGTSTVSDVDGNNYNTVQIGTQCWTQSNLKVSKYRNGDSIPTGLINSVWASTTNGAFAIYNNDPVNDGLYGRLYNHYSVMDSRGLCPTGWHVPTDGEWNVMVKFLDPNADTVCNGCWQSGIAGGALKSTAIQPTPGGWNSPNAGATNSSGFSAGPGGLRFFDGVFHTLGDNGYWWSSSSSGSNAWNRVLYHDYRGGGIVRDSIPYRTFGVSVRCLRNVIPSVSTTTVSNVTAISATTGGNVTQDGGAPVTMRGVAYGTSSSPTISGAITNDGTGTGVFTSTLTGLSPSTTYYVRAYATNSVGTSYGNEVSFSTGTPIPSFSCGTSTVSDVDGNNYNTVLIGTQCWTQTNLKVSKYRNGDNILTGLSNTAWQNTTSGAYAIYDNNPVNDGLYGKLYNLDAVTDNRGLCPTGWHVPTDGEWTTLATFLGGSSVVGGALKSTATQPTPGGWNSPNTGATNSSGFAAGPGGLRNHLGVFFNVGYSGYWWASSLSGADAWALSLDYGNGAIGWNIYRRAVGLSVRCLRN
jgi:uncharacterized protein (TIGR02145 family)